MNMGLKIVSDINLMKRKLILRAKGQGLYENFGQREVGQLREKYSDCEYKEREIWNLISKFNQWCMNFNDSDLRGL